MKIQLVIPLVLSTISLCFSQTKEELNQKVDSIEKTLHYQKSGEVILEGIGTIKIPKGYKYLEKEDAERVLVALWENKRYPDMTLGMLVRDDQKVMDENMFATNIEYKKSGLINKFELENENFNRLLKQLNNRIKELKIGKDSLLLEKWTEFPKFNATTNIYNYALQFYIKQLSYRFYNSYSIFLSNEGAMIFTTISSLENNMITDRNIIESSLHMNPNINYSTVEKVTDTVMNNSIFNIMKSRLINRKGLVEKMWKNKSYNCVTVGAYSYENNVKSKYITEVSFLKEIRMNNFYDIQAGVTLLDFGFICGPRFKLFTSNYLELSITENFRVTRDFVSSFTAFNLDIGNKYKFRISPLYNTEITNFNDNIGSSAANSYIFRLKGFGIQTGFLFKLK